MSMSDRTMNLVKEKVSWCKNKDPCLEALARISCHIPRLKEKKITIIRIAYQEVDDNYSNTEDTPET